MMNRTLSLIAAATLAACASGPNDSVPFDLDSTTTIQFGPGRTSDDGWFDFRIEIPETGRYRTSVTLTCDAGTVWVEDYIGNPDGRTYDITGPIETGPLTRATTVSRDGSPLQEGWHDMRLHMPENGSVERIRFELLRGHVETPETLTQRTVGAAWELVWSDEFDGTGLPDSSKWTHDLGNWGWGNREPQYYTEADTDNARQVDGHLVIEARPNDDGHAWTSARLTTRGKVAFRYGKFEFRAKVPATDGTWAAGWMLGDAYRDEVSWPYCGEIDIMEAVGREIDDATGDGINHGSCHTRAYYFKQGNHISNTLPVSNMSGEFHVYGCEWDEREVRMYVDGQHYYTYDKHDSDEAWPFDDPQCLIVNLAMGGGMGGEIAANAGPQQVVVDYVRVYERR